MNRWDLGGDRKSTWLRNNKQKIRFYININNKEGIFLLSISIDSFQHRNLLPQMLIVG